MNNYELVTKYPWLAPRNEDTGEIINGYNYEFTWLDDMPEGWKKAFGEQMCEEIQQLLVETNFVDKYIIVQVKEKYGSLRWYTNGIDLSIADRYDKIIRKYEEISERTCVDCGKPAEYLSTGWICPYCAECAKKSNIKFRKMVLIKDLEK